MKKLKTVNMRPTIKDLDKLWADVVKARAGHKSEYSGKTERLNAHHIHGKPNYRLRYELDNGVSITSGEHKFIAHHTGRQENFKQWAMRLRGLNNEKAGILAMGCGASDLFLIKLLLEKELKKLEKAQKAE
jgi:hypothetical protein